MKKSTDYSFTPIRFLYLPLLQLVFLISVVSCKDNDANERPIIAPGESGYYRNNEGYSIGHVTSYRTGWGEILVANSLTEELVFVLSDTLNTTYTITDTLFDSDYGKFRCTYATQQHLYYADQGSLQYDRVNHTVHFEVFPGGIEFSDGILVADTLIRQPILDFTAITMRDPFGAPMNAEDKTDWCIRNNLNTTELQLFYPENSYCGTGGAFMVAYPNPTTGNFILHFDQSLNEPLVMILVNPNMEVVKEFPELQNQNIAFQLDKSIAPDNYYRIYYSYNPDAEHRYYGSGDLLIEK